MFDPRLLAGRSIVVTGGGSGLGLAMSKTFAAHGARVTIAGRRQDRLDAAAKEISAAAREGARMAAILPTLPNDNAIKDTVIARTSVLGGGALTRNNVTVTYNVASGAYHSITVQVSDTFNYLTPVAPLLGLGANRPITTRSQFRWESAP